MALGYSQALLPRRLCPAGNANGNTNLRLCFEEEDDGEAFAEESAAEGLVRQLWHLWQLLRQTVLRLLVNFNSFLKKHPYLGGENRCEKPSRHFSRRILPITRSHPHGRSVTRRPVQRNYALRRAVFGLPALRSAPPPASAPVAPPSPSLPPLPSWPDSPPYPLSAFITRIRDLQQEVKDLKGQIQEMQHHQSTATRRVASGLPGAQHVCGTGSAPLQPTGFGGGFEYNFRFSPFTLAPVAPVIPRAIVRLKSSSGQPVLGTVEEGAGHGKGGLISRSSAIGLQLRKSRHEGHDRGYTAFDKLANMELLADVKAGRVVVGEERKQGPSNPRAKDADDIKGGQKIGGGPKDETGFKGTVALCPDEEEEDGGEMSVEDVIVRHVSAFDQIANKGLKIAKDALQAAEKRRDTEGQAVYQNLKVEFGDLRSELAAARSDLGSELMARVSEQNKW
ncbi:hypothetical protein MMC22_006303 [Lobaria immixta]|nr:hypothetical protein [Lobaria immixta]